MLVGEKKYCSVEVSSIPLKAPVRIHQLGMAKIIQEGRFGVETKLWKHKLELAWGKDHSNQKWKQDQDQDHQRA